MRQTFHSLSGLVISSGRPVGALRVEAWDAEGVCPDLIDVAVTDARGAFEMRIDRANIDELLPRNKPVVDFRVFDAGGQAVGLAQNVSWKIGPQVTRLQLPLAEAGAAAMVGRAQRPAQLVVRGTVRRADGSPMANVQVRAFDRSLGLKGFADRELGLARADGDGRYEIRYAMPEGGKVKPDLIVRAGTDTTAATASAAALDSALFSPAPATALVDLGVGAATRPAPSEYRRLIAKLAPVLERGGVELADLAPEALAYAVEAARVRPQRARLAQQAAQMARQVAQAAQPRGATTTTGATSTTGLAGAAAGVPTDTSPGVSSAISAEIWYGLYRMGHEGGLADLSRTPFLRHRRRLQRAIKRRVISPTFAGRIDDILIAIGKLVVARELPRDGRNGISVLLKHALAGHETQAAFLGHWLSRRGNGRTFWTSIRKDATLGPAADDLHLTLRLAMLFDGHDPALAEVRALRQAGRVGSLRDLARWEESDWQGFVTRIGGPPDQEGATLEERTRRWLARIRRHLARFYPTESLRARARRQPDPIAVDRIAPLLAANPGLDVREPLPDNVGWGQVPEGERDVARRQWSTFRREALLSRHVPAGKLLDAVASSGRNSIRAAADQVLAGATDLDLETEGVEAYLARKPAALAAVNPSLRALVVDQLKATQRVLRVTREPDPVETLMADGLDSALRIARMPRARFVARYADVLGGSNEADRAYRRASRTATTAQLALTHTAQCLLGTETAATRTTPSRDLRARQDDVLGRLKGKTAPRGAPTAESTASWATLFGDQAWCACEDCQSVFSPAAYLVDLLHMLDPDDEQQRPVSVLFKRRPDLKHLKLSCENTNTTIPCIDLVNEILETWIAAEDRPQLRARSRDTGDATVEELRAEPKYVNDAVYARLAEEVYPFTLPFNRPLGVVRGYLQQLGTSYREVLERFAPAEGADDLSAEERIAAETLGLSALEFHLIAGTSGHTTAACYGLSGTSTATLAQVPVLLRITGVSYEELVELLTTKFINPSGLVTLEPPLDCVIVGTSVLGATATTWSNLHRFIRLWRATGWDMDDLDLVLGAMCNPGLDRDALHRVGLVKRVSEKMSRPVAALVALWADINSWDEDLVALVGKPFAENVPAVLSALRVAESDLGLIWAHAQAAGAIGDRETETLSNHLLTVLYRYVILAKGTDLRVADLVTLLGLTGIDPFTARDPAPTLAFMELAALVRDSGMSVPTLDYLYRHAVSPAQGPAPANSQVLAALLAVWSALRAVRHETEVVDDPDGTLLRARLGQVHPPEVVATIMEALDATKVTDALARARTLTDHVSTYLGADLSALLEPLPAGEDQKGARRATDQALVLADLSAWLRRSLGESAVVSVVAMSLALEEGLTRRLLVDWFHGDLDTLLALAGGGLAVETFAEPGLAGASTPGEASTVKLSVTASGGPRSARWTGRLLPLGDGDHVLVLRTDGIVRLTIDGKTQELPPPAMGANGPILADVSPAPIALTAGTLAEIIVEYDAGTAAGSVELLWKLAESASASPVAAEHLFPSNAPAALDEPDQGPGFIWRRLHKAALLITGLALTEDELDYAHASGAFGGFRLRTLPMTTPPDPAGHMARWRLLAEYAAARAALPVAETSLPDVFRARSPIFGQATLAERHEAFLAYWSAALCDASGWDPAAVEALFDRDVLTPHDARPLRGDQILARLLTGVAGPAPDDRERLQLGRRLTLLSRSLDLVRRIGVAPRPTLRAWARHEPKAAVARDVVQAVRGRYQDEADWLEVARTRNDPLREAMRDALIAYLLQRPLIDGRTPIDANELFEYFLIDVQMAAAFQTSRIKQAISSVQLFVQRCLLGLERPLVEPDAIDAERWPWISRYRVWEADRKIFLYPENWIEPELRLGKSPFFQELESALAQGPLEDASVEEAFLNYLHQLDDVSRLRVSALRWDHDEDRDVLHVVARTPAIPPVYYYRQLVNRSEWSPWDKIDLDIESSGESGQVHMAMTTFDRRLYLFWALFEEKPEDEQPGGIEGEPPPPPLTHWEIRIAWSTYRNGAWSPKQVSTSSIESKRFNEDAWEKEKLQDDVDDLTAARDEAQDDIDSAKDDLWRLLGDLRDQLSARMEQYYLVYTGYTRSDFVAGDGDTVEAVRGAVHSYLGDVFPDFLNDINELEDWIEGDAKSFDGFLDDVYGWHSGNGNLTGYPLTADRADIESGYQDVKNLRKLRDDAQDAMDAAEKDLKGYKSGDGAVAIPGQRERGDHSIWASTADGLVVSVLRKTSSNEVEKIGSFTLSDDSRTMEAEALKEPSPKDLGEVSPEHSELRPNGFKIETNGNDKGLDLRGLPDLFARVDDATFTGEHMFGAHVTSESKRPFFVTQASECHVAIPVEDPPPANGYGLGEPLASDALTQSTTEPRTRFEVTQDTEAKAAFSISQFHTESVNDRASWISFVVSTEHYSFEPFHHPFTRSMIKKLNSEGVDGLLSVSAQNPEGDDHGEKGGHFDRLFKPSTTLVRSFSPYDIDFRAQGPYALYNWELFFHAPFLIAIRLMQDQRYEEARDWFHQIFDPTTSGNAEEPRRYWKVQPFRDNTDLASADAMLTALSDPTADPALADSVKAQIDQWHRHPAEPHRIAALRLSAYQKAVVIRYLDNLIAWGDSLFAQDTIESINEATQLYILAGHLLGPRPEKVPQMADLEPLDYASMRGNLDELSNLLVDVESLLFPFAGGGAGADHARSSVIRGISHLPALKIRTQADPTEETQEEETPRVLYFCVPGNDKLLGYWDTIDDRLFKIRHCMNLQGVERQLPLFEPPIDPALLVRAAAAGLDIGSVLADLSAPLPQHRFSVLLQKATELCGEVKALGGQLLSALEKRDAEQMGLLRAAHEKALLTAVRDVRARQIEEAQEARTALEKTRENVQARHDYYASRELLNPWEESQIDSMETASDFQLTAGILHAAASQTFFLPRLQMGPTGMGVHATVDFGGENIARAMKTIGDSLSIAAQAEHGAAAVSGLLGGHHRRMDEWQQQADAATRELAQIDRQIIAADVRIEIAKLEQANQELQIENSAEMEEVLRSKYTSQELYSWMIGRISEVHYQAYKLAYDLAKRAERCWCFETGKTSSFIQFGYWDSLKKGLLAGEQLSLALKRMDVAYLESARRDYEIVRQVSLVLHDPRAFVTLRETGSCEVDLPEEMFDADYPGHYFRRLKTVSLTLPCVAGPYTSINCTLTLLSSRMRTSSSAAGSYAETDAPNDARFTRDFGSVQSVATSHGQNDAGMFEVSFRDERYLPFEGAGAISRWRIDLPRDTNAFDFDTLSDVVMRLSYTARDGGKPLATAARTWLAQARRGETPGGATPMTPLRRLFRVRYEFSDAWIAFRNALAAGDAALTLNLEKDRFPYLFRGAEEFNIVGLSAVLVLTEPASSNQAAVPIGVTPPSLPPTVLSFARSDVDATLLRSTSWSDDEGADLGEWTFSAQAASFPVERVKDLLVLVTFQVG